MSQVLLGQIIIGIGLLVPVSGEEVRGVAFEVDAAGGIGGVPGKDDEISILAENGGFNDSRLTSVEEDLAVGNSGDL